MLRGKPYWQNLAANPAINQQPNYHGFKIKRMDEWNGAFIVIKKTAHGRINTARELMLILYAQAAWQDCQVTQV